MTLSENTPKSTQSPLSTPLQALGTFPLYAFVNMISHTYKAANSSLNKQSFNYLQKFPLGRVEESSSSTQYDRCESQNLMHC